MARTLAEKVWDAHVVRRVEGEPDLIYIDLHLTHEVTSPQAYDGLRAAGRGVRRTDLSENLLEQTYRRMESERNALAQDIRSEGEATKTRMNAETDREVTVKIAEARRQSEIIRGEGDAERNRVFAEAFEQDPEFFSFYRSMQAYAKSLASQGTTMVLNPDSEFFKYFGTQQRTPEAAAPAQ